MASEPQHFEVEERQGEVEVEKSSAKPEPSRPEPKKVTWQDNPNDCDLKTQYVRADNLECIDKPVQQKEPRTARTAQVAGCEQYRSLVSKYDWDANTAMAVMKAESGCNPSAANMNDHHGQCSGSFGLFQLACFWTNTPKDPAHNIAKAYEIYSAVDPISGKPNHWQPWGAYTNGSYLQHL